MDLQIRIKKIKSYFRGFEYIDNLLLIKMEYNNKWEVFSTKDDTIKVTRDDNNPSLYYYYGDVNLDHGMFFDLIEETIKHNVEREEKVHLLKDKIEELKHIFLDEDIEVLKTLTFNVKKKRVKKKIIKNDSIDIPASEGSADIKGVAKNGFENNNQVIEKDKSITVIREDEINSL